MVLNRKFTIWFISFGVVLFAFLLYRSASNTGVIEVTTLNQGLVSIDANQILADSNSGRIGKARVEYVEQAYFTTVDVKTGKVKRIVGFEKVLHKSGNEWSLEKPFMNIFQGRLRADITADTGTIEVENVEGSNPSPKSAVLKGNVVIHILPDMAAGRSDSFVYLKQITFDSDRSMFYSDEDVNFVSPEAHLLGKGLEAVYNSITNKLVYLKIKKIDFLNVKGLSQVSRAKETKPQEDKKPAAVLPPPTSVENEPVISEPVAAKPEQKIESFQCLFRDNARLEHGNEVVLADEIAITNIIQRQEEEFEQPQNLNAVVVESNAVRHPKIKNSKPEGLASAPVVGVSTPTSIIATVKCDGPMIIRPDSEAESDDYIFKPFKKIQDLSQTVLAWLGKRNVLIAQRVSYDYTNEIAKAHGLVELVFYPEMKSYSAGKDVPFTIDAQNGAEFITAQNKAVFSGDVRGSFTKQAESYNEENIFHGDKLVVNLISSKSRPDAVESSNVSHITVTGPGVRLESIRTAGGTKLSHIRLKSKRIDYEKATEDVIATGSGMFEYRNSHAGSPEIFSKSAQDKPCFAIVEGFDKLVWDINSLQVKAYSDKTRGVHIGYLPVENNGYGNRIIIDTRQAVIDYYEPQEGKAQLKQLIATGGVVYYEQPKFEFVGRDLYYNAIEEYMTVNGDKDMPCMFNGAMVDGIEYNLKTGSASAVIGKGVGIMPARE